MVKGRSTELEQSLAQLEDYQTQMQQLRQKIVQEEQHLRVVLAPTYLPHDREAAISEQQVSVFVSHRVVFFYSTISVIFVSTSHFFSGRLQFVSLSKQNERKKQFCSLLSVSNNFFYSSRQTFEITF